MLKHCRIMARNYLTLKRFDPRQAVCINAKIRVQTVRYMRRSIIPAPVLIRDNAVTGYQAAPTITLNQDTL